MGNDSPAAEPLLHVDLAEVGFHEEVLDSVIGILVVQVCGRRLFRGFADDGGRTRAVRAMPFFALDGPPPGDRETDLVPPGHEDVLALREARPPRLATVGV